MKILIAGDTYTPPDINGAAGFTHSLANGLAECGHEVMVMIPSASGKKAVSRRGDVEVWEVPSFSYPWYPSFRIAHIWRLSRIARSVLDEVVPDVVHIQSHFVVGRWAARAAIRAGIPLVATSHFHPLNLVPHLPLKTPNWLSKLMIEASWRDLGRVFRQAVAVTSPSTIGADLLKRAGCAKSVRVISCGVDTRRFHPRASMAEADTSSIVFVGRLEAEKHLDELVSALSLMHRPATLKLVGVGSQEAALGALSARLGVQSRVRFLGFVPDSSLADELASSDVFCMPGTVELQSIATLEAMACGLPIVAAQSGALPLLVSPGVNGYLYEPGNTKQLAAFLDELLTSQESRRRFGLASRERALLHTTESTIQAFEELYIEAMEATSSQ